MNPERILQKWRQGHRYGYKRPDVEAVLKEYGFEVVRGTKHWKAKSARLVGCPDFPNGVVYFGDHARGQSGSVDPEAIRSFVKAIDWIKSNE